MVDGLQEIPSPGRIEVKTTDIYEVSADGKTLTDHHYDAHESDGQSDYPAGLPEGMKPARRTTI